ncbi:thiamine pyrophosphate-binding protein [Microtetraspora malaysiensis]|uniref:thiamine pyrophosphate-binding protein n=1 Tax=Microtetraspora malaysiensis TaxID=161358 RepID=UPI003D8F8F27
MSISQSVPAGDRPVAAPPQTAAHVVGRLLGDCGVEHVFGVTGSGNFVATSALIEAGATFVAARHEAGAVSMADGYARAGGRVGVASVHQGPGLTNTITSLVEAVKSRSPLLLVTGDTSDGATRSNFYVPQVDLVTSLGAGSERPRHGQEVASATMRALARAETERRPVVLHLPLDVQHSPMSNPADGAAGSKGHPTGGFPPPSGNSLDRLVAAIEAAQRPLILAGRGVWTADSRVAVEELRDRLGAIMATSAAAHGLFAGNPWSLGICGGFASRPAATIVRDADLVIGLGVSYTKWTTRHGTAFAPGATLVQVDNDPAALSADPRVDLPVEGDVAATVNALLERLTGIRPREQRWDVRLGAEAVADSAWNVQPFHDETGDGRIDPRTLSLLLDGLMPAERTVVVDGGHFVGFPSMYWSVPDPAGYLFTGAGFQSIGLGLGAAVGAAIGGPDRTVVLAIGDGGLHMSLVELDTLARLRLPVLVVVYNDAAYGAEVHHYKDSGADLGLVRFPDTDFVRVAAGFGIEGATVRQPKDLDVVARWLACENRGPLLLDCKIVTTVVADYQAEAFIGH